MKSAVLLLVVFAVGASAQCSCKTLDWADCSNSSPPCSCFLPFDSSKKPLDCEKLVPKCLLMKEEMQRRMRGKRLGGKPVETAIVDNDGIYDPDCDATGQFRTKQCNNTEVCWCVNSAGVRRSDKGDKGIECEQAETYWVRLDLTHTPPTSPIDSTKIKAAIDTALQQRYQLEKGLVKDVQYDENANLMVVDVKKDIGDRVQDLSRMTYYLMKDVKESPLFRSKSKLQVNIDGQNVTFKDVVIYYVDEKAPTFTMKRVTGGIIAVIVVVILVLIGGLLILYFIRKREEAMYSKGQERQMDNVQN